MARPTARVSTNAPAQVGKRFLLVFGAVGKVSAWVPGLWGGVDIWVEVGVVYEVGLFGVSIVLVGWITGQTDDRYDKADHITYYKGILGDRLSSVLQREIPSAGVLSRKGAREMDPQGLAQAEVDQGEIGFPVIKGQCG